MKKSLFRPMIFIALFVFFVSSACFLTGGNKEPQVETQEPIVIVVTATPEVVTQAPVVTDAPITTEEVTQSDEAKDFFIEEFDNGLSNYFYFLKSGEDKDADVTAEDGYLDVKLNNYSVYYYLIYDPFTYGDVRLDVEIENKGNNNNEVSLICRYDPDLGWYEFNISSGGLWRIFYYDKVVANDYIQLYDGGSTSVNMGRDSNTYSIICKGQDLSLYINGDLAKTIQHKDLDRGRVGLGFSSYDSYPVIMEVPWMEISVP